MNRFVAIAPIAAMALSVLVSGAASAQTTSSMPDLRREARASHIVVTRLQRTVDRCQAPDEDQVLAATEAANTLSHHAADVAATVPGREHVEALTIQSVAVSDFWRLVTLTPPDVCYQPPAE